MTLYQPISDDIRVQDDHLWRAAVATATDLMGIFSFSEFFEATASRMAMLMNADGAALIVTDGPDHLRYKLFYGLEELNRESIVKFRFPADKGTVGRVLATGSPLFTPDYANSPDRMQEFVDAGMQANLVFPLSGPNGFVGAMAISWINRQPESLDPSSLIVVGMFAALVGSALYREALEQRLEQQSMHDWLTGLPNRRMLMMRLLEARERANRTDTQVAVAVIDLDGFKGVNDKLGHRAGDEVLVAAAQRIRGVVRAIDMVGRLGGDEFVVILQDLRSKEDADVILKRVVEAAYMEVCIGGKTCLLHASVGATMYPMDGGDPVTLLQRADAAMYLSKQQGGNRIVFASGPARQEACEVA